MEFVSLDVVLFCERPSDDKVVRERQKHVFSLSNNEEYSVRVVHFSRSSASKTTVRGDPICEVLAV